MSGQEARELRLLPGSEEAIAAGCICQLSRKEDKYLINEHCQLHWYILVVSDMGKMRNYMIKRDNEIIILLYGLLIAVITTFGYFLFGVK